MSSKEWISLKQSILNHKDFPKFETDHFNEVTEYNQKIDKLLEDSQTQKELDLLIKQYAIPERIRQYRNPLYFYLKYQNNRKVGKEIIPHNFKITFRFWFIIGLLIVLIIFSFQK